jgi:hypothetical protein
VLPVESKSSPLAQGHLEDLLDTSSWHLGPRLSPKLFCLLRGFSCSAKGRPFLRGHHKAPGSPASRSLHGRYRCLNG